jgi:hypothetical protein
LTTWHGAPAPIRVGNPSDFYGRTVTIRTDPLPFWMALEQFCDKAGLHEDITRAPLDDELARTQRMLLEEVAVQRARIRQMAAPLGVKIVVSSFDRSAFPKFHQQIILHNGRGTGLPVHRAGSVRISTLQPGTPFPIAQTGYDYFVLLQVSAEPTLEIRDALGIRLQTAIDDRGQKLTGPTLRAALDDADVLLEFLRANRSQVVLPALTAIGPIGVELRKGELPSKSLRELSGTVAIQVQTPQVVAVFDRPMTAVGKRIRGEYGLTRQLTDWTYHAGGEMRIAVHVDVPVDIGLSPPAEWVQSLLTQARMARLTGTLPAHTLANASDSLRLETNLGFPLP